MSNKGFIPSAATFIRQVRQNLSEGRYSIGDTGFPIIKELVQNADDAGATQLHIGICEPMPGARHPLLQSPGMYVINDGEFDRTDSANIRRFGENTKSMDAAKIGKFGLGLKSIFHLCEAFFFFGPVTSDGKTEYVADILNPWSDQSGTFHEDWDSFSVDDHQLLLNALKKRFCGTNCFCLWIPLRQRAQVEESEPVIKFFPGDSPPSWLSTSELSPEIGKLIPMLGNLRSIRGWNGIGEDATLEFEIVLTEESSRRQKYEKLDTDLPISFQGSVLISRKSENTLNVGFAGTEVNPFDDELERLEQDEHWPSDLGCDPETGNPRNIREKARQHAAVCASYRKLRRKPGNLSISWAVFLPLGEPESIPLPETNIDLSLFLHGYFFVDAGRNRPIGLHESRITSDELRDDEQLRHKWNQRLADIGTLPLLPNALAALSSAEESDLDNRDLLAVTRAIQCSKFFAEFRNQICRVYNWGYLWNSNGSRIWKLFPAKSRLNSLPACSEPTLPHQVFPALKKILASTNVVTVNSPRLLNDQVCLSWQAAELKQLIESVNSSELLKSHSRVQYLCDFLELLTTDRSLDLHAGELTTLLRQAFSVSGFDTPDSENVAVRLLLSFVPPENRLCLNLPEGFADVLIREMNQQDVSLIFVPIYFDPEIAGKAKLEDDKAVEILKLLAERQKIRTDGNEREAVSVLAAQVLQSVTDREHVLTAVADVPLFIAKDCRNRQDVLASWSELQQHRNSKTLFASPSPRAYSLQRAFADESILLITKECFESILPGTPPSQCTESRIVDVFARPSPPNLAKSEDRIDLLTKLVEFGADKGQEEDHRKAVRYLFHGESKEFSSSDALLITRSHSDIWRRITHLSLSKQNADWRLLSPVFEQLLSGRHQTNFSIQVIGADSAIPLISAAGPTAFLGLEPTPSEYSALLKEIENSAVCKELPIHLDSEDNFVSIEEHCYWESNVSLPPGLAKSITILQKSSDESTWRRQLELTKPLTATAIIEIVLEQDDVAAHWTTIMDLLGDASELPVECCQQLTTKPWLPRRAGTAIRPEDIIDLPLIADAVAHLTTEFPEIFYDTGMLVESLRNHTAYELLKRKFFPNTDTSLSMLGELLVEDERNHVGPVRSAIFSDWKSVVSSMPKELFPCGELLKHAGELYPSSTLRIFEQLKRVDIKFPTNRIQLFLNHLRKRHISEQNARRRGSLTSVFNEYLRLAISESGYENTLREQTLPNLEGDWRPVGDLCCQNDGIASSSVLNSSTEDILEPFLPEQLRSIGLTAFNSTDESRDLEWETIEPEVKAAGSRLREYFESWRDIVPNEQIGGFLALLGDDPTIRELSQQYLGKNRTLDETRIMFGLPEMKAGSTMEDGLTMMSKQRVVVEIITEATVEVLNLLGESIAVPRSSAPKNIFIGYGKRNSPFPHTVVNGTRILCFRLNEIDPRNQTESDLSRLLKDSAVKFIVNAYNSYERQTTFGLAWDDLSQSDQLDISIAQERIIEHGFLILDQLGMRSDPQVSAILDRWDAADRLLAEQRSGAELRSAASPRNPDIELREAKNALREVLENDEEVQRRILEAIKQRVAEYYQYTEATVPFEIFQNADDACVEFVQNWNVTDEQNRDAETFHVVTTANCLTLAHFGRRINQYPPERPDETMGFDNDLWKMLVLSLSNKSNSDNDASRKVTGKFGLGFKSAYLICDRPQILSGRLAFEVTGAMYPRRLIGDERLALDACRSDVLNGNTQSTVVQLPLASANIDGVLYDFLRLAHIAVVFARYIKRCIVNSGQSEAEWISKPIAAANRCFTGTLSQLLSSDGVGGQSQRVLLLNSDNGSILFAINSRQLETFDDDVPSIWVTAPTREVMGLGFLVNGPFALDVGRAQLAREFAQNSECAAQLGAVVGNQLCQIYEATTSQSGWEQFRSELGLVSDATHYDFWDSLFSLIGVGIASRVKRETPADALIQEVFWANHDRGAAKLYHTCPAVPTRIRGDYQRLVSTSQIRYALDGLMAEEPDLFAAVSKWEKFQENAPAGTVVSSSRVSDSLRQLSSVSNFSVSQIKTLNIARALTWEFTYGFFAPPEIALKLGAAVTKKTLESMADSEYHATRELLEKVEFKGQDNQYHPAKELLIGHETYLERDDRRDDERFRARFAPTSRVLSYEYVGDSTAFFDVCREALEAPARLMAEWVVQSDDFDHQRAALEYLARGQLAAGLLLELKHRGFEGTWLANLGSSKAFRSLDISTRNRLFDLLPKDAQPKTDWESFFGTEHTQDEIDPGTVLGDIYDWWNENRNRPQSQFDGRSFLEEYARRTYPFGTPKNLASDNENERRVEWITVFLLALMHTIGRAQPDQHRQFIAKCGSEGWLDMFAASVPESERWMQFVSDYLDRQIDEAEYFHWMRQFVGIFQMSKYLDGYAELFLAIGRIDRPFQLVEVIHSRSSSLFQGGGVSVPPLSRVLGLGSCFVVRELIRLDVLNNPHAIRHAYVPVKRVRDVFQQLGCERLDLQVQRWDMARHLYRFIEDNLGPERATFMNDFDIPFQFIAEDEDLRHSFFHQDIGDESDEYEADREEPIF
jgi:hypothetical protein